jgi:hypothetical protein
LGPLAAAALALFVCAAPVQTSPNEDPDLPDYPLFGERIPPLADPARPLRIVDFRYRLNDARSTSSVFEGRAQLGGFAFVGAEVDTRRNRYGAFLDTHRFELGITEENGAYSVEANVRTPHVLVQASGEKRAARNGGKWVLGTDGALRVGFDWEIVFSYLHDLDERTSEPPSLSEFIITGDLPALGLPTRTLREGSAGFRYQRGTELELAALASLGTVRTEGGFDVTRSSANGATTWTRAPFRLTTRAALSRIRGRLARNDALVDVNADLLLGSHVLASAGTRQEWERGVLRFDQSMRAAVQVFGRRYRFPRQSLAAQKTLELARRAVALGLNERRVYDDEGLRALRERIGISSAREELAVDLEELYRAQLKARNVPLFGVEWSFGQQKILGVESHRYSVFFAIPWRSGVAWPWTRSEDLVEFLRFELGYGEDRYFSGLRARRREVSARLALNRELGVTIHWSKAERTPNEIARRAGIPAVLTITLVYELGR